MERVKKERAGKREAHPSEQQNEAAELPQGPQIQQGFPSNFMVEFNNAMTAIQLENNQRWDAFQHRFDAAQEENRKSFSDISERMDKMDHQLNFLCNTNQFMNEDLLYPYQQTELTMREMQGRRIHVTIENLKINRQWAAKMQRVWQEYQRSIDEAMSRRSREQNKGKARKEEEKSEEEESEDED
ncbi:hypothetical protein PIB30_075566 [Stylosanthes scabra]|uniref:Uncharacterized protein n=1 Tax=Stylosanthes scabra TaxID=79078 RepID=A0ABU6RPV2_9FABA|nr:hypothetical protein [Stylosanthes scabra]